MHALLLIKNVKITLLYFRCFFGLLFCLWFLLGVVVYRVYPKPFLKNLLLFSLTELTAFAVAYVNELAQIPRDAHATNAAFRRWSMQRLEIVLLMHDWDIINRPGGWDRFVSEENVVGLK
jgi:hypothetical protein